MLDIFRETLTRDFGVQRHHRLLLALSGGVDSVSLAHLLFTGGYDFALAHCNFALRGAESEGDEKFCRHFAKKLRVTIYTKRFDVISYCRETGSSIQMAARDLRYRWFAELMPEGRFDFLLTAHHADDLAETMILNLVRGTGIQGLRGIPGESGKIIRPLLKFRKKDLEAYAASQKLKYREDSSNESVKYDRNLVRQQIMPRLRDLNPNVVGTFLKNAARFTEEAGIVHEYLETTSARLMKRSGETIEISRSGILREKYPSTLLHHMLSPFGFNQTQQQNVIQNLLTDATTGALFFSPTHQMTIDRHALVLMPLPETAPEHTLIGSPEELRNAPFLVVKTLRKFRKPDTGTLLIESSRLQYPLSWRVWQRGDKLRPFGMKGFKMVSHLMKEHQLNQFQKKECRVLVNGNGDILWVAGIRSDDRYRVRPEDKNLLLIRLAEAT